MYRLHIYDNDKWNRIGVKLAAQIFVIVANYVISKFFVFKKKD